MSKVIVDGVPVSLNDEKNILEVVRKAGVELPTFCYHSELSVYGACRMCVVEVEKMGLVAACSTPPTAGMVINTNTARTRKVRKMVIELLLANHDRECTTCVKSGDCKLQDLAVGLGVRQVRFGERDQKLPIDTTHTALVRDPNKCILCGDCVRMCKEVQGIGILDFANRGSNVVVTPAFGKGMGEVDCISCGQCASVCPTGALTIKSDVPKAWKSLGDQSKTVVAQIAPAVRVALGEAFGLKPGQITTGKIVAALKKMGFDKVFDTVQTADLTIFEESHEFIGRLTKGEHLPHFTSCCPGWVKYAEQYHPELLDNLSTCRSPQQMFGSILKKFYAKELGIAAADMVVVSIMPCTAKKGEAKRPEFTTDGVPDVDIVLTTQELISMIKECGIAFDQLEVESLDMPHGFGTGAGVIFGATGGVAEATLRYAYEAVTKKPLDHVNFDAVRGMEGIKEATIDLDGIQVKVAVVHGLARTNALIQKIQDGEAEYHIIEVMACPGGCVGGGGQPVCHTDCRSARAKGLYDADKASTIRKSQDNPVVQGFYKKWLGEPNSHVAHEVLHTHYHHQRRISGEDIEVVKAPAAPVSVAVCVGTNCYLKGAYDTLTKVSHLVGAQGLSDKVKVDATFCCESCAGGPCVQVNGQTLGGMTPDKVDQLFKDHILPKLR